MKYLVNYSQAHQFYQITKVWHIPLLSKHRPFHLNPDGIKTRWLCSFQATQQSQESTTYAPPLSKPDDEEQFRVLELVRKKFERTPKKTLPDLFFKQPREKRQPIDQDWGSVWPSARTFHPATVPLPLFMGVPRKGQPSPNKWSNAELMKIPNFLHLSPPVILRQCEAIKKYCTKWPENLETEKQQEYHFPVTVKKSTYLHSSPTIRDPRSRIITLKVNLSSLNLNKHGMDKMFRLAGERFDHGTNFLTLTADRCPVSSQNRDYCFYLLTVLYLESMKFETWENEKSLHDAELYTWKGSPSEKSLRNLETKIGKQFSEEEIKKFSEAVTDLHNVGENEGTIKEYRTSVLKLLSI